MYSNGCVNCNEELYILDQYHEQDMGLPGEDTKFMKKADEQRWQMEQYLQKEQDAVIKTCKCEMPAKIHGKNLCWRCKRPLS